MTRVLPLVVATAAALYVLALFIPALPGGKGSKWKRRIDGTIERRET